MPRLSVNVDHIATLRQQRGTHYPDPVFGAYLAEMGGADGITVHLRTDQRHITERDLAILVRTVSTHLTLEMGLDEKVLQSALTHKPDMVTLVPERPGEPTTERGFDLSVEADNVEPFIRRLADAGITVCLFIDPSEANVKIAAELGADFVELNTTYYAEADDVVRELEELERIEKSASLALKHKLAVAVGHALDYKNVVNIAAIPAVEEFSIGHSIISRAVFVGLEKAVREMKAIIENSAQSGK